RRSWLSSHDAATELRATLAAQKKVVELAEARQQSRDAALASALASFAAAKRAVQTPAQAAAAIPRILPPLPVSEPVRIDVSASPPTLRLDGTVPSSVSGPPLAVATLPEADLKPIYDYLQDCRACQVQLATAENDLSDERAKSAALVQERDTAIRASRGTL